MKFFKLFLFTALLLGACAPAAGTPVSTQPAAAATEADTAPAGSAITLTDGLGRTVALPGPAQRIVSLAPSNTELIYAVGAGPQLVGRDDFTNYPAEAAELPTVGGSMGDYNLEQIVSLKPDLVLAAEINTPEQVKAIEDLGLTIYYLTNPTEFEGMYDLLRTVGQLTGHPAEAEELVATLQARTEAALAQVAGVEDRPRVFYELDGSDPAKPWTAGPGTFIDQLIEKAGGQNVAGDQAGSWIQISQEALLVADPEIILLGDAAYGMTADQVAARAGWQEMTAVQEQRIVPFNDDWVSRPGPRLVDALEELVRVLHPEAGA